MKKRIRLMSMVILCLMITVFGPVCAFGAFDSASMERHKIGVLVYNIADDEVMSFRNYLENYIEEVFPDVEFLYSESITSEEEELAFIQNASDAGVEGILSFLDYDLKKEVELCAKNEIYYIMASSTVPEEDFEATKGNPWFLGVVGPGVETEYQAGYDMGAFFTEKGSDRYFVIAGGSSLGNEMHRQRAIGILTAIQDAYGESFEKDVAELAETTEILHVTAGKAEVCICPGYLRNESLEQTKAEYEKDPYPVVLSVQTLYELKDVVRKSLVGEVDCYSENNLQAFSWGNLSYLTGKYASIIGPSFAAMYNAVTGYAEDFRDDGNAFSLHQGFWTSSDPNDYVEKYTFSSSIALNAYNYEDLMQVCKRYDPDADLEQLKKLAESSSFEEVKARRGM
ncbi:MAG: hypothetical protein IJW67_03080 [Blautia sp.]|nr:hypothetical protein [Blautia sp.]